MKRFITCLGAAVSLAATTNVSADCSPREFSENEVSVVSAYIAYYGRLPDATGLQFWSTQLDENGGNLSGVITDFGNSEEYTEKFADLSPSDLINNLYQQAFGRDADADGLAWYLNEFNAGRLSLQDIALSIIQGAQGEDLRIIERRIEASQHYITQVGSSGVEIDVSDQTSILQNIQGRATTTEACNTITGLVETQKQQSDDLACDNGSSNQTTKQVGYLAGIEGLAYTSVSNETSAGVKKRIESVTGKDGRFEFFNSCGSGSFTTFCVGVRKDCQVQEFAIGLEPITLSAGQGVVGRIDSVSDRITLRDVVEATYSNARDEQVEEILTNTEQFLLTLDADNEVLFASNEDLNASILITENAQFEVEKVIDQIDFADQGFDTNLNVLDAVTNAARANGLLNSQTGFSVELVSEQEANRYDNLQQALVSGSNNQFNLLTQKDLMGVSGPVRVNLTYSNHGLDLDLKLVDPCDQVIYSGLPSIFCNGFIGNLDIESESSNMPVENIAYPNGAPAGQYQVKLENNGLFRDSYTITVFTGDFTFEHSGWISPGASKDITSFTYAGDDVVDLNLDSLDVTGPHVTARFYDSASEDGDRIAIKINDELIEEDLLLTNAGDYIELNLNPGENQLQISALNEGEGSPNTVSVEFISYLDSEHGVILKSADYNLLTGQSGTISISSN